MPGSSDAATSRSFSSALQRRRCCTKVITSIAVFDERSPYWHLGTASSGWRGPRTLGKFGKGAIFEARTSVMLQQHH
jgi:hypothetical protein